MDGLDMGLPSEAVGESDAKETKVVYLRNWNIINEDYIIRVSGQMMRSWSQHHKYCFRNVKGKFIDKIIMNYTY